MTARRSAGAGRVAGLLLGGAVALAACGGGTSVETILGTVGGPQVVAENLAFAPTTVEVTAGSPFGLLFVNRDRAPHNISIYRDASATGPLFQGDVIGGPASRGYDVPALPAGTWFFRCDVHPDMHGTIVAAPASPPAS
jgi:plastocyanin